MGAVLLSGGTQGKRAALPNSRIMIHQGSAGFSGTPSDAEIRMKLILGFKEKLTQILAENCHRPFADIARDVDRDYLDVVGRGRRVRNYRPRADQIGKI